MKKLQQLNDVAIILKNVFKFLSLKDLMVTSKVCVSWHMVSNDEALWRHIDLKNIMVYDWDKFMHILFKQSSITLNTRNMLMPTDLQDLEIFWKNFTLAIKKVTTLNELELHRCPINVVKECILALPRLSVFIASSIKNPYATQDANDNKYKSINLRPVTRMIHLKHLRIKGLTGIILEPSPRLTFININKLRTLSLTSIKSFPDGIFQSLMTVTTKLESLEFGDCEHILDDLPMFIARFTKLKRLRLENCGRWEHFIKRIFGVIRSLKKLRTLELINIEFNSCVKEELECCTGINSLMIIPLYVSYSATTNRLLIDCFKKLSQTLEYLVWGLTYELLHTTDLFIAKYLQNQSTQNYPVATFRPFNNIPILKSIPQADDLAVSKHVDSNITSLKNLQAVLDEMMVNAKIKLLKVHFARTTQVYIQNIFN